MRNPGKSLQDAFDQLQPYAGRDMTREAKVEMLPALTVARRNDAALRQLTGMLRTSRGAPRST